jgi:hypothetical protein
MPLVAVFSRSTVHRNISMWGNLHIDQQTGALVGWIVSTWTERGVMPPLDPKMHWVAKQDGIINLMVFNFDSCSIEPFGEDKKIEPERAAVVRAVLPIWEEEYLEGNASGESVH